MPDSASRHFTPRRWAWLLLQLALVAAVAWLSTYGFLHMRDYPPVFVPTALTGPVLRNDGGADPRISASTGAVPSLPPRQPPPIVTYRDAVAIAAASVVTVHSGYVSKGRLPLGSATRVHSLGSGVIVDPEGYIVTNYHVVEDATEVAVALPDGSVYVARLAGMDRASDLALLKIDAGRLQPIAFSDIENVVAGDVVLAVGNPLGVGQTVTQGIVSAVVRKGMNPAENFIQTDAAINPGNSGGALVDTAGRLVGINTLILSHSGGSEGIGFAIPADYVQTIAQTLKAKGHVARAWLGVTTGTPPHGNGALVVTVDPEGPADRAGIAPGDVLARIGERQVEHPQDLRGVVIDAEPGTRVSIQLVRDGKRTSVDVELAALPPDASR